ncbi:MAG: YraN family protein [Oscillospiraceae bacterium]|nr:YraN family protein [Oscillospiraceae bacterium]
MRKEGGRGEQIALQYLVKKGYRLLQSNYNAPCGEIDLIVYDDKYLVFVEVRMRASREYGHPLETVTPAKQKKIRKTVEHFLIKNRRSTLQPRIDVVAIDAPGGGFEEVRIEHIENAF